MSSPYQPSPRISSSSKEQFRFEANLDRCVISVFVLFLTLGAIHGLLDGASLHWAHLPVLALGTSYVFPPLIGTLSCRVRGGVEGRAAGEHRPDHA